MEVFNMNENKNIDELSLTSLLLTEQFELEVNPWIKNIQFN